MNGSESAECPTPEGFKMGGGFDPNFQFNLLLKDPSANWHIWSWLLCVVLLFITWIVSLRTIWKHIRNYYHPEIQRHKLRILLYPPVYATLFWFSYLRFDYSTTILFFATLFESFAVYNLYTCLEAYLEPFRRQFEPYKIPKKAKLFGLFTIHLKSKFGMHYRVITEILVLQFPVWAIIDSFISIFAEYKGYYCGGSYSLKGAHVYLTIINFCSLSLILTALFLYLAVFHDEWKRGHIKAHGMFWCVKGPIMVIFYIGDVLLTGLVTAKVIKGTDSTGSGDQVAWSAEAVKNGLEVLLVCFVMLVAACAMTKYFGPQDAIAKHWEDNVPRLTGWMALVDGYISYLPEFLYHVACCGVNSFKLAQKRVKLRARRQREMYAFDEPRSAYLPAAAPKIPDYSQSSLQKPIPVFHTAARG